MTDENKRLTDAVLREGFKLEFQVYQKLKKFNGENYYTKLNCPLTDNGPCIDVYASIGNKQDLSQPTWYVVECKGTSAENKLALISQTSNFYNDNLEQFNPALKKTKDKPCEKNKNNDFSCYTPGAQGPLLTFTGDFFCKNNQGEYKKASVHHERNSLYKGIKQLTHVIENLDSNNIISDKNLSSNVVPMIVTNAEICVFNFEENKAYREIPYVVHVVNDSKVMNSILIASLPDLEKCIKGEEYDKGWEKYYYSLL